MRLSKTFLFSLLLVFSYQASTYAQLAEGHDFYSPAKEGYYLFPIKPGNQNTLAGTMGELRSNHFHTGIDVRTESRTGLMVQAAAEGYVSRVAISPYGYGNAIYITHPNGHTTVYAHLEQITGELADYVRKEQYRKQEMDVNLFFRKGQFSVQKGDTIAYSGNSGGSGGPHLHFDIRDKNNKPLNPLHYGFAEIVDQIPPVASKIAIKTLNKDARVNGQFGRFVFPVRRVGNNYVLDKPIEVTGQVGVELYAFDKLNNARFRCGINTIVMDVDNNQTFKQDITTFSFGDQRNILKHMDYQGLRETGERYHKMYVDDGNQLEFYSTAKDKGRLSFKTLSEHPVKITMTDSYGNVSYVEFSLKSVPTPASNITVYGHEKSGIDFVDNTLIIKSDIGNNSPLKGVNVYTPEQQQLTPDYVINGSTGVYLWDLRKGLPHSVDYNGKNEVVNYKDMIPVGSYKYYSDKLDISFTQGDLFDTLYLQTDYQYDSIKDQEFFYIGDPDVPLRSYLGVTLKTQIPYKDAEKYGVYFINERGAEYHRGGTWNHDKISFTTRDFGKFTILKDTTSPVIRPVVVNKNDLKFKIYDNRSGIKEFNCWVDGQWVLMNYDYKISTIWSEKLDPKVSFKGEVKLQLVDNAGNIEEYKTTIY
ncbi:M23 family metallopeptidase [Fulvivirga ligni]|uniref:M23 family metallopeptidase n=1 Tax=Fulvivirga ligni TaxID=2904246 RepID=UPI001F19DAF4|nr:M23 family metallopeptidase [Fulvivirga ligni]UII19786.1 M23 family metallopeptidase [Fulvivirga ligni]